MKIICMARDKDPNSGALISTLRLTLQIKLLRLADYKIIVFREPTHSGNLEFFAKIFCFQLGTRKAGLVRGRRIEFLNIDKCSGYSLCII